MGVVLIEPQLHVVALQALSPECFPICIDSRRGVTKEIHMDWAGALATYRFQFAAHLFQTQQSTRKRAQPSGFRNSHNHFREDRSSHGAWIIGSSIPKSSRMRLFGHIFTHLSYVVLPLASMCPSIQMDYFAVHKLSRFQIKQQVGHFSNFG